MKKREKKDEVMDELKITKMLSLYAANFGVKDKLFAMYLADDHPTIQQSFVRLTVAFLREMAAKKYTDDRNEKAVKAAKIMINALDEAGASHFPLI